MSKFMGQDACDMLVGSTTDVSQFHHIFDHCGLSIVEAIGTHVVDEADVDGWSREFIHWNGRLYPIAVALRPSLRRYLECLQWFNCTNNKSYTGLGPDLVYVEKYILDNGPGGVGVQFGMLLRLQKMNRYRESNNGRNLLPQSSHSQR